MGGKPTGGHPPVSHQPEEDTGHHGVHQEDEAVHEVAGIVARGGRGGLPHVSARVLGSYCLVSLDCPPWPHGPTVVRVVRGVATPLVRRRKLGSIDCDSGIIFIF